MEIDFQIFQLGDIMIWNWKTGSIIKIYTIGMPIMIQEVWLNRDIISQVMMSRKNLFKP